ncbi:MAG: protein translocase subunit SecF [Nitrospirota bacterium]|nr:protein translocase subunit SecF [Nitrospirota bacterium]
MIELIKNTKIDFMGKRNIAFIISGIISLIGLFAVFQIANGKANLGIDFAGGTSVQLKFEKPVKVHDIRKALEDGGIKDFDLQELTGANKMLIRAKNIEIQLGKISEQITAIISEKVPDNKFVVDSTTEIGPKVGGKLRADAGLAIIFATIGILIYVAIRFKFNFAVGATVATFHDVTAVLAIFFLLGKEINLILVTALLTIAGYSLTDTVVVFDRIRENLRTRLKDSVETVMNQSINEVLSRTFVTSLTVLITSIALFFFGGEVLHDFSLAMILGVLVGTYSSIFVASPIVLLWGGNKAFSRK